MSQLSRKPVIKSCANSGLFNLQRSQRQRWVLVNQQKNQGWKLAFQETQNQVLELIATGKPLNQILTVLVQQIEALSSQALCSIFILNPSGTMLYPGVAPSFPESYQKMLEAGLPVGPYGTCGTAIYRKQSVGTVDVAEDPLWDHCRDIILAYGFRAYWSRPIFNSRGEALGTFGMVYRVPRHPSERDRQLIEMSAHLAGIAIERQRSDEQLRLLNAGLEQQVQQRTTQLQRSLKYEALLNRITDKVRRSLNEDHILQAVVQELGQVIGCLCCEASLYNPERTARTVRYEYTVLPSRLEQVMDVEALPTHAFCPIQIPHLQPTHHHTTILSCPIQDDQSTIGELWLFKPTLEIFDEAEIQLVQQVANQCAIALRQAHLHQMTQKQVNELELLNRLKDDFLSTVSHELRTPIANMKMAIHLLSLYATPEQQERYLSILKQECSRESELINDLLDLQRLEASSHQLPLDDWLDLPEVVSILVEPFQTRVQEQEQALSVRFLSTPPPLKTHRNSLERILSELLNNACKYTAKAGQIELVVSYDLANQPAEKPMTTFRVRNQAEIPAHELGRIFGKFYRVPNADPWKRGGTGLGLALVNKLVERLQGTITVESQHGWTTFTLRLP